MLQAEVSHPSDDEALQIHAGESGGPPLERRENVESCPAGRVGHRGHVDERLDRPVSKLLPYPLIFLPHLVVRRVRRPIDTYAPEVFEAHLDGTVDPIQCDVEFHAQASDGIDSCSSAARKSPLKNSHSARWNSSAKVSACRCSQLSFGSSARPATKYLSAEA